MQGWGWNCGRPRYTGGSKGGNLTTGLVKGETSRRGVTGRVAEWYGNGKLLTNCQFAFK